MTTPGLTDEDLGYGYLLRSFTDLRDVGVLVGVREDKGGQVTESGMTLAGYASANEFGTTDDQGRVRIPERSFLRSTVDEQEERYGSALDSATQAVVDGRQDVVSAFGRVGLRAVRDVQRKIRTSVPPPNAPATIAKKGSSTTLVDSGRLRASIDFEVVGANDTAFRGTGRPVRMKRGGAP